MKTPLLAHRLRELAVRADADPRSVRKEIERPGSVRGLAGERIRKVLQEPYPWMARLLKMRKWDGTRVIQNLEKAAATRESGRPEGLLPTAWGIAGVLSVTRSGPVLEVGGAAIGVNPEEVLREELQRLRRGISKRMGRGSACRRAACQRERALVRDLHDGVSAANQSFAEAERRKRELSSLLWRLFTRRTKMTGDIRDGSLVLEDENGRKIVLSRENVLKHVGLEEQSEFVTVDGGKRFELRRQGER